MNQVERLLAFRRVMAEQGFDACIVGDSDPHQSEYPALCFRSRTYLSGFEGSAGTLVLTAEKGALWTDFRYWLAAREALEPTGIELMRSGERDVPGIAEWLVQVLKPGQKVACPAQTTSPADFRSWQKVLARSGIELVLAPDLLQEIWLDRPDLPQDPISDYRPEFLGATAKEKLDRLRQWMDVQSLDWYLVSDLSELAWLLNLRGSDVPGNPVFYGWLLLGRQSGILFTGKHKVGLELYNELSGQVIEIADYHTLAAYLQTLPAADRLLVSPGTISMEVMAAAAHVDCLEEDSILAAWKACKATSEVKALEECMVRDGAAVVRACAWVEAAVHAGTPLDEAGIAQRLIQERQSIDDYRGESFPAIVGSGPNGAIVHYAVPTTGSRSLTKAETVLLDCGGQYLSGTTDCTRVLAFQTAAPALRKAYTLVLKGHIALSRAVFPVGTTGTQLDILARQALWAEGLNYGHGTGHGVGFYLSVHEGPQRIAPRASSVALEVGMLLSNEPGYYQDGAFGIRIENMIVVENHPTLPGFLCFRTLTCLPYEPLLIDPAMLDSGEKAWLVDYSAQVAKKLKGKVGREAAAWLSRTTTMPW